MSEAEARVLGTGTWIEVEGKEYTLSPVGMGALQEVQREAVAAYKRDLLTSYRDGLSILKLDPDTTIKMLEKKLDEIAPLQISDMPKKRSYNVSMIDFTESSDYGKSLYDKLEELSGERPTRESECGALLMMALDSTEISEDEVYNITKIKPRYTRIPYDTWWVTATHEGALSLVHQSVKIKHPDVERSLVGTWPLPTIMEAASNVEALTAPEVKNT